MPSIDINRAKYRKNKSELTWLDLFLQSEVKIASEETRVIKDKEVKFTGHKIDAVKLFKLVEANGLKFEKIRAQVEAEQVGAIGRARMILAGALKRKIAKGETIKDSNGDDVARDEAFEKYAASVRPAPAAPASDAA